MDGLKQKSHDAIERIAIRATRFIGSTQSIFLHTLLFIGSFFLYFFGIAIDKILLVVTTIVSLEAIYLSIFIQMSVNRQARRLQAVARDVEEIQEDVEEIAEDVEGIEKDVDEIQKDVEDIQEDVEGIEKDVEEIAEDVEEINEEETAGFPPHVHDDEMLSRIENTLGKLIQEINELKNNRK